MKMKMKKSKEKIRVLLDLLSFMLPFLLLSTVLFSVMFISNAFGGEVHIVKIKDFNFHPADLTIRQGDTVLWVNEMPYGHWVISGTDIRHDSNFFSPLLLKEHKFSYTFKDDIVQDYYCPIHSMQGRITVLEAEDKKKASEEMAPEKKKRRKRRRR